MAVINNGSLSADGSSADQQWRGGTGFVTASGTFGGGTLELELSLNGGSTYVGAGTGGQLTSAGSFVFELPDDALIRVTLSGSTGPSLEYTISA